MRDAQLTAKLLKEAQKKAEKERAKKRKRGGKRGEESCASTTGQTNKRKRGEEEPTSTSQTALKPVVECNTFALDEIAWVASQVVGRELFVQYASVKVITGTSDLRRLRLRKTNNNLRVNLRA